MGSWHCVNSSCAQLVYREYLPPVVRWRYPGEDWQEIEGDDYSIEDVEPQFEYTGRKAYQILATVAVNGRCPPDPPYGQFPTKWEDGELITIFALGGWFAPIWEVKLNFDITYLRFEITYTTNTGNAPTTYCKKRKVIFPCYTTKNGSSVTVAPGVSNFLSPGVSPGAQVQWQLVELPEYDVKPCRNELPDECIFTVYFEGVVVYQNTQEGCPEVETLPCRLSKEYKEIGIEKIPYLERFEVIAWAYQNLGLSVYRDSIPNQCLNIYKNNITTIIPLPGGVPTPTNTAQAAYGYIAQICSGEGCPPPLYDVVCDCNQCESCPEGTCAVECETHVCCYDALGNPVKSIPIENYCGE